MRWIAGLFTLFDDNRLVQNFQKIQQQFSDMLRVTEDERDTGARWYNGDSIYEKLVEVASLANAGTGSFAHGIGGFNNLVDARIIATDGTNHITLGVDLIDSADVYYTTTFDGTLYSGVCRIQYTK